ncbi:GntR family transcriptional regulator, partial [Nocardia asiatica]|uniref:GntR family transcriptional regulator n=1 Tax=Nocardia asiatica TaxID=209252 RepID=UPI003CC7C819
MASRKRSENVVSSSAQRPEPPYRAIVAEIRARIATGDLRPGDRAPSIRQIAQRWGVAGGGRARRGGARRGGRGSRGAAGVERQQPAPRPQPPPPAAKTR